MVAAEVRAALARRPALLFTVGGLGPTDDDLTLAGVALATDRPLELNAQAERMVRERYQEFAARGYVPFAEMNEARRKMARLPRGATPVTNPIGGAPGVLLELGETAVVSLPGVPEELQAIVDESLADLFERIFGAAHYEERALVVELQDESAIAAQLRAAQAAYPHVYVKSRAKLLGSTRVIRVTLAARDRDAAVVDAQLTAVAAQLLRRHRRRRLPGASGERRRTRPERLAAAASSSATGERRQAPVYARWSSMKCVETSPRTKSSCSSTRRWKGMVVLMPSTWNWASAQRERASASSRSRPQTMSLPSKLS